MISPMAAGETVVALRLETCQTITFAISAPDELRNEKKCGAPI